MKKLLDIPNLFFAILLAGLFWPAGDAGLPLRLIALAAGIEVIQLIY